MTLHFTYLLIILKFLLLDQMSSLNCSFVCPISFSTYPLVYLNDISNLTCSKQAPNLLSYHGFPILVHYTLRVAQNINLRVIFDSFLLPIAKSVRNTVRYTFTLFQKTIAPQFHDYYLGSSHRPLSP